MAATQSHVMLHHVSARYRAVVFTLTDFKDSPVNVFTHKLLCLLQVIVMWDDPQLIVTLNVCLAMKIGTWISTTWKGTATFVMFVEKVRNLTGNFLFGQKDL